MRLNLVWRFIFSILILFTLYQCDDLDRENPLDPKNLRSYRDPALFVEAFINTNPRLIAENKRFNIYAVEALDSLISLYGSQLIIAEYHRNTINYSDSLDTGRYESLYSTYILNNGEGTKGVPDLFINGSQSRVQGAFSKQSVYDRMNQILGELVTKNSYYTLEPDVSRDLNGITARCKIARLGNESADNLRLRLIFISDLKSQWHHRVVVSEDIFTKYQENIDRIRAGQVIEVEFETISFTKLPDAVIFSLSDQDETQIYHSVKYNLE